VALTQIEAYHRPPDVETAWRMLRDSEGRARLLSGGSDLAVSCPPEVTALIDLADTGLDGLEAEPDGGVTIGATTTFTQMLEHPAVDGFAAGVVSEMLVQVGSVLHRNSATIGGHLARARLSDVIPVLLALDATVVIHAGERRELPLTDYLAGAGGPHVVVAVRLPGSVAASAAAFERFSRVAYDHAIVNAACRIDGAAAGPVAVARVVVGETASVGRRVPAAEEALTGRPLDDTTIAAAVEAVRQVATRLAGGDHRRHLAGVLVGRCLATVAARTDRSAP